MKKTIYSILTVSILATLSSISSAEPYNPLYALSKEYSIVASAKHIKNIKGNKQIKYEFVLNNTSNNTVSSFTIGHESIQRYDLGVSVVPFKERDSMPFTAPSNWEATYQETARYDEVTAEEVLFDFGINCVKNPNCEKGIIPARTIRTGFSLISNTRLPKLATSFAELSTSRNKWVNGEFEYEMIQLTKGDTIAPTASLAATLVKHPTKTGFYNVNLKVTAKDNYDPLPEIVFTSVQDMSTATKNTSPFNAGAYTLNTPNNVTTGAYPSIITFAADANAAKQYKINYTVTDASDNKTDVSTTVTVPKR